jgi:hypothetical protein
MKTNIQTITIALIFILASATISAIYPGESTSVESKLDNITNYTISGNTTIVLMTQINDTAINITLSTVAVPEVLTFTFNGWAHNHPAETQVTSGGGGSSLDKYNASYWINYWNIHPSVSNLSNISIIPINNTVINGTTNETIIITPENPPTIQNWWTRFWLWLKSLFGK